ncbi:hypothetical protein HELRODRAFT_181110 [Helobdella robusta]|uniref:F5/8 type C domain-containing protein n=1 Tax=Helobdella robusta TaxID=6412 RepID=T1FGM2_HELRO|nr:hypothetical protein HELRODRAFT_181110 [Helobdella robusta]ESN93366.1 hypothetical protein HELRODRAFT_181110 [Helobdella robusta]
MITNLIVDATVDADGCDNCKQDLGMGSGMIPDPSISASSTYYKSVAPQHARVNQEKDGGAWCPKPLVAQEATEWLQVDLEDLKVITMVETQGRYGMGQGQEFTPHYMLEYRRDNASNWIRYKNITGGEVKTTSENKLSLAPWHKKINK